MPLCYLTKLLLSSLGLFDLSHTPILKSTGGFHWKSLKCYTFLVDFLT